MPFGSAGDVFPFIWLGTVEEVEAIGKDRRIWKLGVGMKVVIDYAVKWSERYLEDLSAEMPMQTELEEFLAAGQKPVVFTPGSANVQAERFFETVVEAVKRLGIRAVFVPGCRNS
ncbi:MAG: hypothetical protein OSA84_07475 [Akkermansiaceae bacterium]|nr:hypothetical protein [Akkermansiaceae bacterium]